MNYYMKLLLRLLCIISLSSCATSYTKEQMSIIVYHSYEHGCLQLVKYKEVDELVKKECEQQAKKYRYNVDYIMDNY